MMRLTTTLLIGLGWCASALADDMPPTTELVQVDGQRFAGELVELTNGDLRLALGELTKRFEASTWVRKGHPVTPEMRPQLLTGDHSVFVSKRDWTGKVPITFDQASATINTASVGKVTVPRAQVRAVLIEAAKENRLRNRLLKQIRQASDVDRVWLVAGDQLNGQVESFDGTKLQFSYAGQTIPVLAKNIAAIALSGNPGNAPDAKYLVGFADGSLIEASDVKLSNKESIITIGTVDYSLKKLDSLVFIQSLDASIQYVSDLKPVDFRHTPYFTGSWPLALDRSLAGTPLSAGGQLYAKGIAMHSASRAVYRIPAGSRQFLADLAIDDSTDGGGSVLFRAFLVTVEGLKQAAESPIIRGGDAPHSMAVDVSGAKAIVLIADYAENGDQQDHANWLDARFVRQAIAPAPAEPTSMTLPGLENVFRLSSRVISGSGPESAESFAALADSGVATIVSVDGAKPLVDLAVNHAMRYVHIPIGYDGLSRQSQLSLVRVLRDTEGPIYIHCHHGKHRGPAAAAIACLAEGTLDASSARRVLEVVGTSEKYRGLWRDVAEFTLPNAEEQLPKLVETAQVSPRVAAMSQVDQSFAQLQLLASGDWKANDPKLSADEQAALLVEGYREAGRFSANADERDLAELLSESETMASDLQQAIAQGDFQKAVQHLATLKQACTTCHDQHR